MKRHTSVIEGDSVRRKFGKVGMGLALVCSTSALAVTAASGATASGTAATVQLCAGKGGATCYLPTPKKCAKSETRLILGSQGPAGPAGPSEVDSDFTTAYTDSSYLTAQFEIPQNQSKTFTHLYLQPGSYLTSFDADISGSSTATQTLELHCAIYVGAQPVYYVGSRGEEPQFGRGPGSRAAEIAPGSESEIHIAVPLSLTTAGSLSVSCTAGGGDVRISDALASAVHVGAIVNHDDESP